MRIDILKKGKVFKNWKILCSELEISNEKGNTKKANEKELSRFCEWHKEGQKIIIDRVFRNPKESEDGRMDKMTQEVMGNILVELICTYGKEDSLSTFFDKNLLYELCEMYNPSYKFYKYKQDELSKRNNIDLETIRDFYNISNNVFISNINKGGKWLKSKRLATMFDTYAVKTNHGHRVVTKEEHAIIQSYEAKVIEEIYKTNRKDLFLNSTESMNYGTLRKKVCKIIDNEAHKIMNYNPNEFKKVLHGDIIVGLIDIEYYYPVYEFIGDVNKIKKYYDKQVKKIQEEKEKSNNRTIEKINESVNRKITNAKDNKNDTVSFGKKINKDRSERRSNEKYKEDMDKLIDEHIKLE